MLLIPDKKTTTHLNTKLCLPSREKEKDRCNSKKLRTE